MVQRIRSLIVLKGDYLCYKGDVSTEMFFIRTGSVEIRITDADTGDEKTVAILYSGSTIGEISVILQDKRTAAVRARENCELAVLTADDFFEILTVCNDK